jgi:membrane-associated phospholipid phosphatase
MKIYFSEAKKFGVITLLALGGIFLGIGFLDRPIAQAVMGLLQLSPVLCRATANIPDLLLVLVCIGTAAMWTVYFFLTKRGVDNELTRFLRLAATSVPVAHALKSILQFAFGRINTRAWLRVSGPIDFRFFQGTGERGGFPSGHMTVFTAFFAALWCCYPRYRLLSASLLLILGVALIATDYHFVSDVIAGAYAGLLVTVVSRRYLERTS